MQVIFEFNNKKMNRLINVLIFLFFLSSLGAETSQKNADSLALLNEKAGTSTYFSKYLFLNLNLFKII